MIKILSKIFRVKSVDSIISSQKNTGDHLKRSLKAIDLIFMGVGAVIGAGIFSMIGTATVGTPAEPGAGPGLMLSFVLTALGCGFSAMCYAEFAAMVPIAGSAYTYSYATLGELIAWIIGWDLIIEYAIGNVAVAISWSGYFVEFLRGLQIQLPLWLTLDYRSAFARDSHQLFTGFPIVSEPFKYCYNILHPPIVANAPHIFGFPIVFNLPAVFIVSFLTYLIVLGIKESARFNEVMVVVKLLVLTLFCLVGYFYIKPANFSPFMPNGFGGVIRGASLVFFAYIGFDAVSTMAEETENPGRNLPIGIVGSLIACTIIYIIVTCVFVGVVPYQTLRSFSAAEMSEPLAAVLAYIGGLPESGQFAKTIVNYSAAIVAFGAVVANTAVLLVFQIGQPRIFFSMSRDGLLPPVFMSIHPVHKTPAFATIITGIFVAFFSAFMDIKEMADLCNIGTLFAFVLVCAGVMILRIKDPDRTRPFKAPGGFVTPILGILSCLTLTIGLSSTTWIRFGVWLAVGLIIYFFYGIKNSRLAPENASKQLKIEHHEDMDKF